MYEGGLLVSSDLRQKDTVDISAALSIKRMFYSKIGSFQKRENFYVQLLCLETVKNTIRETDFEIMIG